MILGIPPWRNGNLQITGMNCPCADYAFRPFQGSRIDLAADTIKWLVYFDQDCHNTKVYADTIVIRLFDQDYLQKWMLNLGLLQAHAESSADTSGGI